jgi:hypothetical protein
VADDDAGVQVSSPWYGRRGAAGGSPPITSEMPMMPSLTTGISSEEPFSLTYSSQTIAVVGKYKWLNVLQDS